MHRLRTSKHGSYPATRKACAICSLQMSPLLYLSPFHPPCFTLNEPTSVMSTPCYIDIQEWSNVKASGSNKNKKRDFHGYTCRLSNIHCFNHELECTYTRARTFRNKLFDMIHEVIAWFMHSFIVNCISENFHLISLSPSFTFLLFLFLLIYHDTRSTTITLPTTICQ